MKIKLNLSNLNYKEIVGILNVNVGKIIGFLGLSSSNNIAVFIINKFDKLIISKLTEIMGKYRLNIDIRSISAKEADDNCVELDIDIRYVDTASLIKLLYPICSDILKNNEKLTLLGSFLDEKSELVSDCVINMLKGLDESEKQKLLVDIINAFDDKLIDLAENLSHKNGVNLSINELKAE